MTVASFRKQMTAKGWPIVEMGGGCQQFEQIVESDGVDARMRIADVGEPTAPCAFSDPCVLIYSENFGQEGEYVREFASVTDCLAWIETAEYVLPFNGDGPEANGWTFVSN